MGDTERRAELQRRFLADAQRTRTRGTGLLAIAAVMWVFVLWKLLLPHSFQASSGSCDGLLFERLHTDLEGNVLNPCYLRSWSLVVGVLAVSVPVSIAGAVLHVKGRLSATLSHHIRSMTS